MVAWNGAMVAWNGAMVAWNGAMVAWNGAMVAWNGAMGHIGKDLEGIGYGMLEAVFRYLSGENGEDHETLRIPDHPAETRPLSVCGFAVG
jgi:hypothetical protein